MTGYGRLINNTVWNDLNFPIIQRSTGQTIAAFADITAASGLLYPQWEVNDFHVRDTLGSSQVTAK